MYLEEQLTILIERITDLKKSLDVSSPPVYESRTFSIETNLNDELLTTAEVAKILKCNRNQVGIILKAGLLPYLILGSRKIRRRAVEEFLQKYEGWDLSDPYNPRRIR